MTDKKESFEKSLCNFTESLRCIVYYDCHKEWLIKLAEELESAENIVPCPFDYKQWHSEEHVIWMILCGMFGDWGSSIRGGWIEQTKDAAKFIRSICSEEDPND